VLVVPKEGWLTAQCQQRGINWVLLPALPDATVTENWRQQFAPWPRTATGIARIARRWRADIVHSNSPRMSYHGGLGARLAGATPVTYVHDIGDIPYKSRAKAQLLYRITDWVLTPSHAVEEAILDHAPQFKPRMQTVYYGWDMDVYADVHPADLHGLFGIPAGRLLIGSIAAMTPWKGQDVLIETFGELHARRPETHLLIVGGIYGGSRVQARFEEQLHAQVAAAGLEAAVTFTGWREDAWSIMRGLDLYVHVPRQPDPLPTSVLHASALGCAIVGSRTGGIPEIVPDGVAGLLVAPGDAADLNAALERLIVDPDLRAQLRRGAHQHFLERFSHRQMRDSLAAAYDHCLAQRRRGASSVLEPGHGLVEPPSAEIHAGERAQ
jgi:glycosyltransferase involved in cell wall biosynthesis